MRITRTPQRTAHDGLRPRRRARAALAVAAAGLAALAGIVVGGQSATASSNEPNVVLILTDDQTLEEMAALPRTQSLIGGQGVTFSRAYASYPLCCPSRATIFSGQYMHNHNVRGNNFPTGGWDRFVIPGTEKRALPTWLKSAGYYNVEIGKYMNGYLGEPPNIPVGWDEWYGKISEYNVGVTGGSIYFNYRLREDPPVDESEIPPEDGGLSCPLDPVPPVEPGEPRTCLYGERPEDYQTDVVGNKAVDAIKRLSGPGSPDQPFFLSVNFNAPHSPYVPAPRHDGFYASLPIQEPESLNEKDISDKPRFLRRLPKLGKGKLGQIANRRRARLEMLISVDEQIERIGNALLAEGQLNNTYLIFLSDNGYFSGEHRIRQGKYLPHDPSSKIPMLIRGPGIPAGQVSNALVSNVDVAATIADVTNATPTLPQDGTSLIPFAADPTASTGRPILLEGDTGDSIDDDGTETATPPLDNADRKRLKRFYKKRKAQIRKIKRRCKELKRISPKRAQVCAERGVGNLEQEPTDTTYKLSAPAYSGLRTERYALFLYATGELELYDMKADPLQLESVHRDKRYVKVRKYLLDRLNEYRGCIGAGCNIVLGPDPKPLKKRKAKKVRKPPAKEPKPPKP